MKRILQLLAACGIGGLALAATQSPAPDPVKVAPPPQPAAERFVAHEWGTFTGFAGSDGVHLPFDTTVGSDLPNFVINRTAQATRQGTKLSIGFMLSKGGGIAALQRMETPVIYFYTDKPRDVNVRVDFPRGLLTEFYPPVRAMTPAFGEGPREIGGVATGSEDPFGTILATAPATLPRVDGGSLDWGTVRIIPHRRSEPEGDVPTVRTDHIPPIPAEQTAAQHYGYARETDAALVRFSDRPGETHDEKFLFYRGLGNFSLPVTLRAGTGGRFDLHNASEQPISFALLLRNEAGRASFSIHHGIAGNHTMTLPAESVELSKVGDAITGALISEGLYEKEAKAMVKTWSSSWLGEEGIRVLYIVSRPVTDSLLPLRMSPPPQEVVRVLVGRIDVLTPEQEMQIQSMLASAVQPKLEPLAPDDAKLLRSLGRFRTAAIERAAKLRGSGKAHEESQALDQR